MLLTVVSRDHIHSHSPDSWSDERFIEAQTYDSDVPSDLTHWHFHCPQDNC
jgi:hypothetical protein